MSTFKVEEKETPGWGTQDLGMALPRRLVQGKGGTNAEKEEGSL